ARSGAFLSPRSWPGAALGQLSTHDLPTLAGFWTGRDIETRRRLRLLSGGNRASREIADRRRTLDALRAALAREGLGAGDGKIPVTAAHRFLARSRSRLVLLQLEDLAGALDQINLPGTIDEYPNWRRKLPRDIRDLFADRAVRSLISAIDAERRAQAAPRRRPALGTGAVWPRNRRR